LPRTLAIAFGLVGIDLAHAFEQFLRVGFIDFRGAGSFASTAAARGNGPVFLSLIWHTIINSQLPLLISHALTSQIICEVQVGQILTVFFDLRLEHAGITLGAMKAKEKKSAKVEVPFDPILFAVSVPSRSPTAKDVADAKEGLDDAVEPKDHATMQDMVKDL